MPGDRACRALEGQMTTYYSQVDQDRILNEQVFCGMRNGVFVDVGAHDGTSFSNTLVFERELGWTGLCIEPNPDVFTRLNDNRSAVCLNIGIANEVGTLPFIKVEGYAEMSSGLSKSIKLETHRAHQKRDRGTQRIVFRSGSQCQAARLGTSRTPHFRNPLPLSRTEGNEPEVLASIDFRAVIIHVITVEANYNEARDEIDAMLFRKFELIGQHEQDLYFINRRSPFTSKGTGPPSSAVLAFQTLSIKAIASLGRARRAKRLSKIPKLTLWFVGQLFCNWIS